MKLRNKTIPYIGIMEPLMIEDESPDTEIVIVAQTRTGRLGLGVDRVIGMHKTVVKALGRVYRDVKGFTGAATLGNGEVALIIDVNQIREIAENIYEGHSQNQFDA